MSRHIAACGHSGDGPAALVLTIADRGAPSDYWLHLEVPASAPLRDLDGYLRDLWLECCGHLSLFEIGGRTYSMEPDLLNIGSRATGGPAGVPIADVLQPGDEARHLYDMGSTTELQVHCLEHRPGHVGGKIRLLARNASPEVACSWVRRAGDDAVHRVQLGWRGRAVRRVRRRSRLRRGALPAGRQLATLRRLRLLRIGAPRASPTTCSPCGRCAHTWSPCWSASARPRSCSATSTACGWPAGESAWPPHSTSRLARPARGWTPMRRSSWPAASAPSWSQCARLGRDLAGGRSRQIVTAWVDERFELIVRPALLTEWRDDGLARRGFAADQRGRGR